MSSTLGIFLLPYTVENPAFENIRSPHGNPRLDFTTGLNSKPGKSL